MLLSLHVLAHTNCIHTHTPGPAPGSPKWLAVGCSLPTSVQLSWGAVPKDQQNGIITGYVIQINGPDTKRSIPTTGGYITFKEVSDLRPSTEYSFSVSAKTVAGSGPAISVSFIIPQEGETLMHIIASTLMELGFV